MSAFTRHFSENPFVFHSRDSVLHERDLGIAGERFTVLTPPMGAAMLRGIQNCPFCGTGFTLEVRIDGERIAGRDWTWLPNAVLRSGKAGVWQCETLTIVPGGGNGCLMRMRFTNLSDRTIDAPVQIIVGGSIRKEDTWVLFPLPAELILPVPKPKTVRKVPFCGLPGLRGMWKAAGSGNRIRSVL